ncbi:MAG: hypothetical protein K6F87_05270 [Lachnospiraceae bacterium]|nr:hypothetical protein [Lachnospiraceae bacterium]
MNPYLMILLAVSYIFYALLDIRAFPVLIIMSLLTYAGGRIIFSKKQDPSKKNDVAKVITLSFIAVEVAILCFFKYSSLFMLPVGMSFYMLMAISFLVDTYRGEFEKYPSVVEVLVYISFFPTVISGPIMKSKDLIPQFEHPKKISRERVNDALWMVLIGAFLKLVMANRLCVAVDKVYATPLVFSGLTLFLTSVTYTLQLLFDFAGYSYMAIGVSKALGFDIMQNFNLPYLAANPSEFWRRWHISLSSWLKDYVYIPLGGNRRGSFRTYINIFIVMVLSGLWHGSTVNFLIWGILHGLGQIVYRAFTVNKKDTAGKTRRILSVIINFLFVNFLWIPFRAPDLKTTWTIFTRIVTMKCGASYYYVYTFIFAVMLIIVYIIGARRFNGNDPLKPLPLGKLYAKIIFCVILIMIGMFAYFGNGAFIYAQF